MLVTGYKERPIIMGGFSVNRINQEPPLKTQTRRVIKNFNDVITDWDPNDPSCGPFFEDEYGDSHKTADSCPYGLPGDRLWVKEAHWKDRRVSGKAGDLVIYDASPEWGKYKDTGEMVRATHFPGSPFESDLATPEDMIHNIKNNKFWYKAPLIFMPMWAARIWLEIVGVHVEKIQDISDEDIKAEGLDLFALSCHSTFFGKKPVKKASFPHWISGPEGQSGEVFCEECAGAEVEKIGEEFYVDGGWDGGEEDGPRFCEKCGDMLDVNYSDYGIEQEIEQFENHRVVDAIDVSSILAVLSATNDWDRDYPEHAPKLRRICFRELWDSLNAKPKAVKRKGKIVRYESYPWEDINETREFRGKPWYVMGNPWVYGIEFKKI